MCGKEKLTGISSLRFARRIKRCCAKILRDEWLGEIAICEGNFMLDLASDWRCSGWRMMCRGDFLWLVELWGIGKGEWKGKDRYLKMNEDDLW